MLWLSLQIADLNNGQSEASDKIASLEQQLQDLQAGKDSLEHELAVVKSNLADKEEELANNKQSAQEMLAAREQMEVGPIAACNSICLTTLVNLRRVTCRIDPHKISRMASPFWCCSKSFL